MSNNVASKRNDKGVQATGVASWLFWSGRSPLTSALQSKQRVVLPTVAAFYQVMRGFFSCPHQTHAAQYHSAAARERVCVCASVKVSVLGCAVQPACSPADGGLKKLSNWRPASTFRFTMAPWQSAHKYTQLVISACDCVIFQHMRSRLGSACPAVSRRSLIWGEKISSAPRNSTCWLEPDWNKAFKSKRHAQIHCWVEAGLL